MSLKYLLLGALMERSYHGYEFKSGAFKRLFGDFGINDGQLYPTLHRLENERLIERQIEHQDNAPNRHVYSITEKGRRDFLLWLHSDQGEERSFRYDFLRKDTALIRCNFIRYLDKPAALQKIQQQMRMVERTLTDLQQAREAMISKGVDILRVRILEYSIQIQETRYEWLQQFYHDLENRY